MRHLKKKLEPDSKFVENTKTQYLSLFESKFPNVKKERHIFIYAFRGVGALTAILIIFGATSTYAYQKNVDPESFLYPLKISQEKIILSIADAKEKPAIHLELAEKRLKELQELKIKNPESKKIEQLAQNVSEELKQSASLFEFKAKALTSNSNFQTPKENNPNKKLGITKKENSENNNKSDNPTSSPTTSKENEEKKSDMDKIQKNSEMIKQELEKTDPTALLEKLAKQEKACKIYEKVIKNNMPEIDKQLKDHPDIINNFQNNCEFFKD